VFKSFPEEDVRGGAGNDAAEGSTTTTTARRNPPASSAPCGCYSTRLCGKG